MEIESQINKNIQTKEQQRFNKMDIGMYWKNIYFGYKNNKI